MLFCNENILVKLLIIGVMFSATLLSQITFERTYGGNLREFAYDCLQIQNGGYIIIGFTRSYGAGENDVWLLKTDSLGDTIWTKTYGGVEEDGGRAIQKTLDDGFIIAGYTAYGIGFQSV